PEIIRYFKQNGYTFTTISDIIGKTKDEVMPPEIGGKEKLLSNANLLLVNVIYYGNKILLALFMLGIVLVMLRMLFIAVLALMQKWRTKRNLPPTDSTRLVSIIIPAYNEEKTVVKTVQTLLSSDYKN